MAKLIRGLVSVHLDDFDDAEKGLLEALAYFTNISSFVLIPQAHFALALLNWRRGQAEQAIHHLREGLRVAEERSIESFVLLDQKDLLKVCVLAMKYKVVASTKHINSILAKLSSPMVEMEFSQMARSRDPFLRSKACEIRRAMHRASMPKLHIRTLGKFQVWRGGFPIDEKAWERNQPKSLLKALIARRAAGVSKDALMEDLWPEVDPQAQERNFRVSLHRLRKSLEPEMIKEYGSSYVYMRDNLVGLDEETCEVDVDVFFSLVAEGEKRERDCSETVFVIPLLEKAMQVFKGEFLPDDLYAPWADPMRSLATKQALRTLLKLANWYRSSNNTDGAVSCYGRYIQIDPYQEEVYRNLMELYYEQGRANLALRIFEECKKVVHVGLDAEPEEATIAVYRRLIKASVADGSG